MTNKVVFISGGARGLGAYLAKRSLDAGHSVYCGSRKGTLPEELSGVEAGQLQAGKLDVTAYGSCEASIEDCLARFGRIDVLVNNASGYVGGKPIGDYTAEELRLEIETTLLGSIFLTNAFVAKAEKEDLRQHVIFLSAITGLPRDPGNGLHCVFAASKAGLIRFSETINDTLRVKNSSAHVLVPNNIRSERFVEQNAISLEDVYRALSFITESADNLHVNQLVLNPFQVHG